MKTVCENGRKIQICPFLKLASFLLFLFWFNHVHSQSAGKDGVYFIPVGTQVSAPDADGFIRQWYILDPIEKGIKTNILFTDSYVREEMAKDYFPGQMTIVPKDGERVKVGKEKLKWHHLLSNGYNVQLYRFSTTTGQPRYGILYWVVAVIDAPEDICDIRLSAGSNSASMWWLNGQEALILSGDRRMVMDDGMSHKLCLCKGRNILRGAIVNGPGMSNFCVRFLDSDGNPVTNIEIH